MADAKCRETRYGFEVGPMIVERLFSDDDGGFTIIVRTEREQVVVRSTPTGFLRVGDKRPRSYSRHAPFEELLS